MGEAAALKREICTQLEYYFSAEALGSDRFLQRQIENSHDGSTRIHL